MNQKQVSLTSPPEVEALQGLLTPEYLDSRVAEFVQPLDLPVLSARPEQGLYLHATVAGLKLCAVEHGKKPTQIQADFIGGKTGFRLEQGVGRKQPIARAVGAHRKLPLQVIDLTAGLGRDAMVLAMVGCHVTMIERQPVVAALLLDGLQRAAAHPAFAELIETRVQFICQDASVWLSTHAASLEKAVFYYDPMFPRREKTSLVKKEMRLFQQLIGADSDTDATFEFILGMGADRVVVKRPRHADCVAGRIPAHQIVAKSTRWDVYLPGAEVSAGMET